MLSCTYESTSSNKLEKLLRLVGWFIWNVWRCTDLQTLKLFLLLYLVNFSNGVTTTAFVRSIITVLVLVTHFCQWEALIQITLKIPWRTTSCGWSCKKYHFKNHYYHFTLSRPTSRPLRVLSPDGKILCRNYLSTSFFPAVEGSKFLPLHPPPIP